MLRQHITIGHKELEGFVKKLTDEIGTSCGHDWESNLLDRLKELVMPSSINLEAITPVHLSDKVIEGITSDWLGKAGTVGLGAGKTHIYTCFKYSFNIGSSLSLKDKGLDELLFVQNENNEP